MDNYFKENFCCKIDYLIPYIIEGLKKEMVPAFLFFNSNPNIKYVKNFDVPDIYYLEETALFCLKSKLYYTEEHLKGYFKRYFSEIFFLKPEFTSIVLSIHNVTTCYYVNNGCTFHRFDSFKFDYELLQNFIENHKNIQNF